MGIESFADFKAFVLQFIKFGLVGLSNTILSLAIYYLVVWMNPAYYQVGNALGWIFGVLNSVIWNKKFVFTDSSERFIKILGKSYLAYGGSFILTLVLSYIQIEWIGISPFLAPLFCLIFTIPINFMVNKFWAFRKSKNKSQSFSE